MSRRLPSLAKNLFSLWGAELFSLAVVFASTPWLVRLLKSPNGSNELYGIWLFINAFFVYFRLIDLGFYQGVIQYFARYYSLDKPKDFSRLVSTALAAILTLGCFAMVIALILCWWFPSWAGSTAESPGTLRLSFLLMAIATIAQVGFDVFSAALVATEKFLAISAINAASRFFLAFFSIAAVAVGGGLVALASVFLMVTVAGGIVVLASVKHAVPELELSIRGVSSRSLRELWGYGKWLFLNQLGGQHLVNIDAVIVPILFGVEVGAVYNLAHGVATMARRMMGHYGTVFMPRAISADAARDHVRLQQICLDCSRVGLFLSANVFLALKVFGESFLYLWLRDPSFLWEATEVSAATVLVILSIDAVLFQGYAGPSLVLIAMRKVRALALVLVFAQGLGAIVAYLAGSRLGVVAIPWAIVGGAFVGRVTFTALACSAVDIPFGRLMRETILRPLAAVVPAAVVAQLLVRPPLESSWLQLSVGVGLTLATASVAGYWLCLNEAERGELRQRLRAAVGAPPSPEDDENP